MWDQVTNWSILSGKISNQKGFWGNCESWLGCVHIVLEGPRHPQQDRFVFQNSDGGPQLGEILKVSLKMGWDWIVSPHIPTTIVKANPYKSEQLFNYQTTNPSSSQIQAPCHPCIPCIKKFGVWWRIASRYFSEYLITFHGFQMLLA